MFRYGYIDYTLYDNRVNLREEKNMQTSNADWITTKELAKKKVYLKELFVKPSVKTNT